MLCAAIRLAENGWHVRAIEEKDRPGGAWRTIEAFGFERVEPAVHLLENRPRTYRHLNEDLGVELQAEKRCEGVIRGHRLGFHTTRIACFACVGLKGLLRRDLNRARLGLRSALRSVINVTTPFMYPKNGSGSLLEDLLDRASRLPIEFQFDTTIKNVIVDPADGHWTCRTSRGDEHFDRMVVSSRAHAEISIRATPLEIPARRSTVKSLLMLLRVAHPIETGYIEVLGDDIIRRIRNVGRFARPRPDHGTMILCVQLRERHPATEGALSDLVDRVQARLRRLRVIGSGDKIVDQKMEHFTHETIPDASVRSIGDQTGKIVTGLTTTDFAEDLANLLELPTTSWKNEN